MQGLEISLEHLPYDWADTAILRDLLGRFEPGAVAAGSSEGGLFQYGSQDEILANLKTLWEGSPRDFVVTGSVSWEGPMTRLSRNFSGLAVRAFEPGAFEQLVHQAGWIVEHGADGPTRQIVSLRKRA